MKFITGILLVILKLSVIQGEYRPRYVGCYTDSYIRALSGEMYTRNDNTIERCVVFCGEAGYKYAGLQEGNKCFCGSIGYDIYGASSTCYRRCSGNFMQVCGGFWMNSVYAIDTITTTATRTTTPSTTLAPSIMTTEMKTMEHISTDSIRTSNCSDVECSTDPGDSAPSNGKGQKNVGVYIGISLGALVGCIIIAVLLLLLWKRGVLEKPIKQSNNKNFDNLSYSPHGIPTTTTDRNYMDGQHFMQPVPSVAIHNNLLHNAIDKPQYAEIKKTQFSNAYAEVAATYSSLSSGDKEECVYENNQCSIAQSKADQLTIRSSESEPVYSLAQPITDELIIVENDLYGV